MIILKERLQRAPEVKSVELPLLRAEISSRAPPFLSHVLLTMHRETIRLIDDQQVLVLVDNSSAQRLSKHIGVDSLQLLCEPH